MVNFPEIDTSSLDEPASFEWLEELPILTVEPETRSDAHTEALPGVSELLAELETLTIFKEQAR